MKMTGVDRLFVDTKVLIYATNELSPWHGLANAALQADIFENLQTFQREFTVVEDTRTVATALETLTRNVIVAGKQVHDANIVAAMQIYGIRHLLTFLLH